MTIRERFDNLKKEKGISSDAELLGNIYEQLDIIKYGTKKNRTDYELKVKKNKSNFAKMLDYDPEKGKEYNKKHDFRPLNKDYYIPLERIFNVTIDYIVNGYVDKNNKFVNKGIRYVCSTNDYNEFVKLGYEKENDRHILFNYDEYNKTIIDYIIEFKAIEGLKYLFNEHDFKYDCSIHNMESKNDYLPCYMEDEIKIVDLLSEENQIDLFKKMFDFYDIKYYRDDDRALINNVNFIEIVLSNNNLLSSLLEYKEMSVNEYNRGFHFKEEYKSLFVNPAVNILLNHALKNIDQYYDQINMILDFGLKENQKIIDYVKNNDFGFNNDEIIIDKEGHLKIGPMIVGRIVNPGEKIESKTQLEINIKISQLNEMINLINYKDIHDYFRDDHRRIKYTNVGHVLKLASKNNKEYEVLKFFKNKDMLTPTYFDQNDGIDEFDKYDGISYRTLDINKVLEIVKYLKKLHEFKVDNDKVYVHGDMYPTNFYFNGNELKMVVNWDNCHYGNIYEDLSMVIMNYSGMATPYMSRMIDDVLKNIKQIFETYSATNEYVKGCIDYLRQYLKDQINNFEKNYIEEGGEKITDNNKHNYEKNMWVLGFLNSNYNELINLIK